MWKMKSQKIPKYNLVRDTSESVILPHTYHTLHTSTTTVVQARKTTVVRLGKDLSLWRERLSDGNWKRRVENVALEANDI